MGACQVSILPYAEALERCNREHEKKYDPRIMRLDIRCLIGAKMPELIGNDINGKQVDFLRSKKKYTFLNLWFIECTPCIEEIPLLNQINEFENITVKSICRNSKQELKEFLKEDQIRYAILPNGKKYIEKALSSGFGYPTSYLLNNEGIIVEVFSQIKENSKQLEFLRTIE